MQIVDIALKAISPAVNDPSTAISCVDQLSSILIRFAAREDPLTLRYDPLGTLRVNIPHNGFHRLAESAFEQIRLYARTDAAVSLRLMRASSDLTQTLLNGSDRSLIITYGRRLLAGLSDTLGEEAIDELNSRLFILEQMEPANL